MIWLQSVDVIDLMLKGLLIGIIASAPMGPVGILVVQRTLNKGRWYGFITGVGAAVSDLAYALVSGLGMSFVLDFIENPMTMLYLRLLGGIVLFGFGYSCYHSPVATMHKPTGKVGSFWQNMLTGFLLTLSNPLIVFLFLALFARFDFVVPYHLWEQSLGYLALFSGALLWWLCLTTALKKVSSKLQLESVALFNRLLGTLVMAASSVGLIVTLIDKLC